jgi:hypothetical protein
MYSSFSVDFRDEDHRPFLAQPGRHRAPEPEVKPVAPPAWATERARPIPALVGERPTAVIPYPTPLTGEMEAMRLPSRHPQKARWWDVRFGQLGRALDAAKRVLR